MIIQLSDVVIIDNNILCTNVVKPNKLTLSFLSQIPHSDFFLSEAEELEETMSWKKCSLTYKDLNEKVTKEMFKFIKFDIEFITHYYELPHWFT